MRRFKRTAAAVLTAAMAVSLLSGCVGDGSGTGGQTQAQNETQAGGQTQGASGDGQASASGEVGKPASITWMVHTGLNEENGTAQWAEEFERLTGIKMNLNIISNNEYKQMLELSFASDTVPDVFDLNGENLAVYAKQNAIADLTDLIKGSELYGKVDPEMWESITLNGRIYGIPQEIPSGAVTYVRKDWLDRLGMDIPKTYDEYIEMLRRFKNEIPECKVPVTAPGKGAASLSINLPEFFLGATQDFVVRDGKWVDGMSEEGMVQALTNLQAAYAEGLVDTELITNTTSNCRDQWYAGSVGVFNYWGGLWGKTLLERVQQNVPEAEVVAIPPIEGAVYEFSTPNIYCINGRLPQEQVESLFKYFLEYMNDGKEGQVLFQNGVEGLHWEQDGEYIKQLPTLSNPEETLQKAWITPWLGIAPMELTDKKVEIAQPVTDSLAIINEYGKKKQVLPVSETLTKVKADLQALKEEVVAKIIMGDMTVEEGLARYKSESEMYNIGKVLEEMNAQ